MPALRFRRYQRRLESWAHIAGLAATAWLVLPSPRGNLLRSILQGWIVASLALAWALVVFILLRLVIRNLSRVEVVPTTFRTASAAVWFAPAILLPPTPSGLVASVVLVMGATRLLCSRSLTADWSAYSDAKVLPIGELSVDAMPRHLLPALGVSFGLQGALALMLLGHFAAASGLLSLSVATLTSIAISLGAWSERNAPNLPRSVLGLCLTFLLAMVVGQALRGGGSGDGSGFGFGAGSGTGAFFGPVAIPRVEAEPVAGIAPGKPNVSDLPPTPPPGATGEVTPDVRVSADANIPGSFPGVILWPDVEPEVTLVAPFPAVRTSGGPPALLRPFVIPFGGEYWMYRWPFARPPRYSYFRRGSPAKLAFSTTDRTMLQMEALQKLDRAISLTCCSKIEVTVENSDRAAVGTRLELVVIDNGSAYKPPLSLGLQPLRAAGQPGTPMVEVLDFAVPAAPHLTQFDEFKVVFHRDPMHQDHSSRVALLRFTLIP
ncbi:MAG TPA: hypothetical protein VKB88_03070 [Bryobacteraceae bacterium]|nr:hypothetical protein [Bryobacteraceae bacterium]